MNLSTYEITKGQYVVFIEGEITNNNNCKLEAELFRLLALDKCKSITLDFTNCESLSSSALSIFLHASKAKDRYNTKIEYCNFNEKLRNLLKLTAIDKVINIIKGKTEITKNRVSHNVPY